MAIKERKQITGTTAQIDAYAGHEGQIVWDTEKKTLVGMSGTAGTNYPLAPQAYVDTKFLPLTGGTLTGPLYITKDHVITSISDKAYKGLELYGGPSTQKGAFLVLRHNDATAEAGIWYLAAQNLATGQQSYFRGGADNLWFNFQELERIQETVSTPITGSGDYCKVIRYTSGLQILYAFDKIFANSIARDLVFVRPFIDDQYTVSAIALTNRGGVAITYASATTTGITVYRTSYTGAFDFETPYKFIAIGRWK